MSENSALVRVRGVPGRFIPYGNRMQFLGWRPCDEGEKPEAVLTAGRGPRDTSKMSIVTPQGTVNIPKKVHGIELRLVTCEVTIEHNPTTRKAVTDGDITEVGNVDPQ